MKQNSTTDRKQVKQLIAVTDMLGAPLHSICCMFVLVYVMQSKVHLLEVGFVEFFN